MESDPTGFIVTGADFLSRRVLFGYGLGYMLREITALKDTVAMLTDEQAKLLANRNRHPANAPASDKP